MHLSQERAKQIADILDEYEEQIASANAGKADTLESVREELKREGLKGAEVTAELTALKAAIARRRLEQTNPEKAQRKEDIQDSADAYYGALISKTRKTIDKHPEQMHGRAPAPARPISETQPVGAVADGENTDLEPAALQTVLAPTRTETDTLAEVLPPPADASRLHGPSEGGSQPIPEMEDIPDFLRRTREVEPV